jgi:1-acyl-sn-glycerol-3-phosphate acyltransferase
MKQPAVRGAPAPLYFFYCWLTRQVWRLLGGRIEVSGVDNIPRSGPCIVIANHQSYLDPLFLHAAAPRILHAMAKSTQFASPAMGWLLAHIYVFPVRRYQIDPQAVRTILRRLADGHAVMVYVEGERTWDGRLQPARLGVIRTLLKANVPVIPCRIDGSYDVWPRWDRKIKRGTVRVSFGPPLVLPHAHSRVERERVLPEALQMVTSALSGPLDRRLKG